MKKSCLLPRAGLMFLAISAAFPQIASADDQVERLIRPESSVSLRLGIVDRDNQRFGTYNGLAQSGVNPIGDASIVRRDDDTATWLRIDARDVGLPTQELRVEREKQGDWGYSLDYSQTPRFTPYDVHTGVSGTGTTRQAVPNAAGVRSTAAETEIKTERYKTSLGLYKALSLNWDFSAKFQSEEKEGNRLFGRGSGTTQEFLAEPIGSTTRQLDLVLGYTGDKLQLNGGYYGSFFNNRNPSLTVTGGAAALATFSPIALPPDNLAHQVHIAGGYAFTPTTRGTFKYAYSKNTQTDAFILPVTRALPVTANTLTNDSGRSDLGGRVDTTLFQLGLTSRPLSKLSLLANLRYEDRDDKTTVAKYITSSASSDGYNEPRSLKTVSGKLEGTYQLPVGVRATGGVDYENKERGLAGIRVVGYREKTEETSWRFELRRALFDAVSGSVALVHADRNGSSYRTNSGLNLVQPIYIADRDRNKLKASVDWSPLEALSLQFMFEDARDRYGAGRGSPDVGPRSGDAQLYSVDATYAVSDKWQVTAYASELKTRVGQATGTAAGYWTADMTNVGVNYGVGVKGKLSGKLDLGVDLLVAEDLSKYGLGGAATSLPDIDNVQTTVKLFATYAWDKNTLVRLDYIHDRRKTNDWTWNGVTTPYVYTDGSWLYQDPNQTVNFVGVAVQYSFR